jgi:hypothetical protein
MDGNENTIYYHGTTDIHGLNVGDLIKSSDSTGILQEKGRKRNLDKVFFTKDLGSAWIYAGRSVNMFGGNPIVCEISPIGEIEKINDKNGTSVFMAKEAMVKDVIKNIEEEESKEDTSENYSEYKNNKIENKLDFTKLQEDNSWYKISSPFGVDPFGAGELSDKVRTQPYGNVGGDSKTGLFEPSSGKSHANDYFSESDNTASTEKRLEKQKEKIKMLKKKKRKENKMKISWDYSFKKQSSLDLEGENNPSPLIKKSQWGIGGPTMPFWTEKDFLQKSYIEKNKEKNKTTPPKQSPKQPTKQNKVKKMGLEKIEQNPFKKALKSSVTIKSVNGERSEIGSGFFINNSMIMTCFHVVSPSGSAEGSQIKVTFNGDEYPAKIFAYDSFADTAVIVVDEDISPEHFFPILSENIDQGDEIIVVGTPLGFENLVTDGIVSSGVNYTIEDGGPPYFFISADISPGNSGGPIIDKNKEAIAGMSAAVITRGSEVHGLSAGIPAEQIKRFLDENGIEYRKI